MRCTWFFLPVLFAVTMTAILSAAPVTTRPSGEVPEYMAGLNPKGIGKPEGIVRRRWEAVMGVLRDEKIDKATKQSRVDEIITPVFDLSAMTRLSLGKANWRKFTTTQREEFSKLFVKRLKESYVKRIADYGGEKVSFKPPLKLKLRKGAKPAPGGPRIVHVPVEIASKTSKWIILHKFRKIGELYRIYDMEIEGISILRSYRSQFNDVLRRGKPEDVLSRLRKPPSKTPEPKGGKRS